MSDEPLSRIYAGAARLLRGCPLEDAYGVTVTPAPGQDAFVLKIVIPAMVLLDAAEPKPANNTAQDDHETHVLLHAAMERAQKGEPVNDGFYLKKTPETVMGLECGAIKAARTARLDPLVPPSDAISDEEFARRSCFPWVAKP